ncbi:hypothetical protein MAPG_01743 [Magnaporthiopsis poae ATCC 64411]|uniref:Uncharacterized protein n=1 Tax=Magnaporthiopsis poae (strain ATCC 64411 / 73-15) TaxID=644358 RepID=A0A0C4DPH6_MAGP6|nr:hypothetical protein MAPG_01743 [Magnaporthiopsis poae ATCC 64411]
MYDRRKKITTSKTGKCMYVRGPSMWERVNAESAACLCAHARTCNVVLPGFRTHCDGNGRYPRVSGTAPSLKRSDKHRELSSLGLALRVLKHGTRIAKDAGLDYHRRRPGG